MLLWTVLVKNEPIDDTVRVSIVDQHGARLISLPKNVKGQRSIPSCCA